MKAVERVDLSKIQQHLDAMGTGVKLPWPVDECQGYRVDLDARDVNKLVLWFQFEHDTKGHSCNVTDLLPSAMTKARVKSFIEGNLADGKAPADLRTTANIEPVIVANDLVSDLLYIIDGSHRIVAQHLSQKGFQDVPVFICVHPDALKWPYIPQFHQRQLAN